MELYQSVVDRVVSAGEEGEPGLYPSKVRISADHSLEEASGLYSLEHDADGTPFRWTGPQSRFSFQFLVDRRTPARFRLRFGRHVNGIVPDRMGCFADGEEITTGLERLVDGYELTGLLPARPHQGGSVLTFICPHTQEPSDAGASADNRRLGVTFRTLEIESIELGDKSAHQRTVVFGHSEPVGELDPQLPTAISTSS
jgi:hypothetical protein